MTIRAQYLETATPPVPTVRPPVTPALVDAIARVEAAPPVATYAPVATNGDATYAKPVATNDVATNKPVRTANRRKPEAYREYQRSYMAKRRAADRRVSADDCAALADAT